MERPVKAARLPPAVLTVVVPASVPLPGLAPIATETLNVPITGFPRTSWTCAVIESGEPAAPLVG
jgi:hypothetical protein